MAATVDILDIAGFTDGTQTAHATVDIFDVRGSLVGTPAGPATVDILDIRAPQPAPAQLRYLRKSGAWALEPRFLRVNSEWVQVSGT